MYQLKRTHVVKADLNTCWNFFSSPANLKKITPDYMGFDIITSIDKKMHAGMMIEYRVSPIFNISLQWVTEITHVTDQVFFVDEQRIGPYKIWHHEHHFKETPQGVEMTDIVSYVLPFGFVGRLLQPLISKKLNQIFDFRQTIINSTFP
jgi:ligand-binding SRPBCC domain-containing protein